MYLIGPHATGLLGTSIHGEKTEKSKKKRQDCRFNFSLDFDDKSAMHLYENVYQ
jgi:hypothetical protein